MMPRPMRQHAAALLSALLFLPVLPAFTRTAAAGVVPPSSATATLGNFRYALIDLTPDDGIAPWISFADRGADLSAGIYFDAGEYVVDASGHGAAYGTLDLAHRGNLAAGLADADGARSTVSMADRSGYAYMASIFSFSLSPYTRVVFAADAAVESALAPGAQRTWAIAGLSGILENGLTEGMPLYSTLETQGGGGSSGVLSVSGNALGEVAGGHLVMFANTLAWASVAPVPEPAPATLFGTGAVLLGGAAVRRSGRRRSGALMGSS